MHQATGPWVLPPLLPDDPKRLCLVELQHERKGTLAYYALRYARHNWWFQDRTALSPGQRVVRWAYIATTTAEAA